jgi:hypothetical protein
MALALVAAALAMTRTLQELVAGSALVNPERGLRIRLQSIRETKLPEPLGQRIDCAAVQLVHAYLDRPQAI